MRVNEQLLHQFTLDALLTAGADKNQATHNTDILIWCDKIGRDTQGVWRLPMIVKRLQLGLHSPKCQLQFNQVAPALCRLDGDAGLGYYVASKAMERAIELASTQGVACVAVHNGSHLGAVSYYVEQAAKANMIGLCFSNSVPKVIPPNGNKRVIGTNPLAIGCPRSGGQNLLIDMATASSAGSQITKAENLNRELESGKVINTDGSDSNSAADVHSGGLHSMAGGKGFALGLMVELLSAVITGAGISHQLRSMHNDFDGPANNGHLMLAIAIEHLMPIKEYFQRVELLIDDVQSANGRVPGELRWQHYLDSEQKGILIDTDLQTQLEQLAGELNIRYPW